MRIPNLSYAHLPALAQTQTSEIARASSLLANENRGYTCFTVVVALQRTRHLDIVAVVGIDEVGTDQQQYDVGRVELLANLALKLITPEQCGGRARW